MSAEYIPGTCNIGRGEVKRRQLVAVFGLFLTVFSVVSIVATDQSKSSRLSIFLPALIFSIGFVQSRKKFCLAYGLMGTFNLGKLGDIAKVQSPEDRRADRKTALTIFGQAVLLAGGLTILLVLIPF